MTTILLTASRALLDTEESKQWYEFELRQIYLTPDEITVITGDASSDEFALQVLRASLDRFRFKVYNLQGGIYARAWRGPTLAEWKGTWMSDGLAAIPPKRLPLVRNEAMVNACPADTICHAFVAPWSRTHGTEHTLGLAARRGLQGNKCKLCRNGMTTPAQALRYICRWYLETTGQRPSAENSLTTTPKEDE
jgi:hypothetical protein